MRASHFSLTSSNASVSETYMHELLVVLDIIELGREVRDDS